MTARKAIYESLRVKMEEAGFLFEREQKPHRQKRKEAELVFIHPQLIKKLEDDGFKVNAHKFYIKPLSDESDCEIGFVTGKSSPLYKATEFNKPNTSDSFDETPAWSNREIENALDKLLTTIKDYLNQPTNSIDKDISTFLFAWNPKRWDWADLQESIDHLENVGYVEKRWSCGNSKNIKKGDRIFLIRLGEEPRGIMGSGYAKSSYYCAPHWDKTQGKNTNYIDIEFDILINPEKNILLDKELLDKIDPMNLQMWFPQQSGISIKPEIIDALESNWFNFIRENKYIGNSFVSNDVITDITESFIEGKSKEIIQTRYERNPQARKTCLKYHGYSCQICDFNFEKYFGEIGKGFIHVHHINSIAEIGKEYEINPKNDLIPVCPNCHAMLHSKRPAFTIEEIKKIRRTTFNSGLT
jgi:5-methylcytosine-specific restriction protein A